MIQTFFVHQALFIHQTFSVHQGLRLRLRLGLRLRLRLRPRWRCGLRQAYVSQKHVAHLCGCRGAGTIKSCREELLQRKIKIPHGRTDRGGPKAPPGTATGQVVDMSTCRHV